MGYNSGLIIRIVRPSYAFVQVVMVIHISWGTIVGSLSLYSDQVMHLYRWRGFLFWLQTSTSLLTLLRNSYVIYVFQVLALFQYILAEVLKKGN